ncbi:MAG: DUF4099 domain-containing protein [Bacteroidetes bacterium]|nr:DUF4099 domain-containing protein [Bacteroidota bacterium]
MLKQIYDEQDLPMEDLHKIGLAANGGLNLDNDDRIALLSGRRTSMLRLENLFSDGLHIPFLDAKISLKSNPPGDLDLLVHPIYKQAMQPSFLTDTEAEELEKGEVPNIEKAIKDNEGHTRDVLVEFDRETNEFIVTDQSRILAPDRVNGEYLSLDQKERYRKGKEVELPDGTVLQYSGTEKQGIRSNKLALIASLVIDGGLSFALYQGLHYLFGEKKHRDDADIFTKGYFDDLEEMQKQERIDPALTQKPENQYNRSYSRTGSR